MNCIMCGARLTQSDYCPKCGQNVSAQKKAMALSDFYYNEGLEKAQIRDLSGAITCLIRSLKMNKANIQARNLLGLVYFETGEVVAALSEWVISKNLQPTDNLASVYIEKLQKNANRLDVINNSIKKFNQCLEYCRNGNPDMAKMQLKRVLADNPKLIKGYHLAALLYMQEKDYEKARRALKSAARIDKTNTTTLRFLREVEQQTGRATSLESRFRMKERVTGAKDGSMIYKSGNDYVIQPPEYKEKTITNALVNIVIGLLVGAAALWFLIVPAVTQKVNHDANEKIVEYSGKMAAQAAEIARLQEEMDSSTESVTTAQNQIGEANDKTTGYENLIKAWQAYREGNQDMAANAMEEIDAEQLSVEARGMYDTILSDVGSILKSRYKEAGLSALKEGDYDTAVEKLEKAAAIGKNNKEIMFNLAQAYNGKNDIKNANKWYEKVIENFQGSKYAKEAAKYLKENEDAIPEDTDAGAEDTGDDAAEGGAPEDDEPQEGQPIEGFNPNER